MTVNALLGGGLIQFAAGADQNLSQVQLYRARTNILNRATDKVGAPLPASTAQSYSFALGDTTRANLLKNTAWVTGDGWTFASGAGSHTPVLSAADLEQPVALTTGRWYRTGFTMAGRVAGNLTPRLRGGSVVSGTAVSANGNHIDRLQAVSGNNRFVFTASADFEGSLSSPVLYLETASCLAQGTHYLWLEPQSSDGLAGPVAGPFTLEVI